MSYDETQHNRGLFGDCLSGPLVHRSAGGQVKPSRKRKPKGRRNCIKPVKDEAEGEHLDKEYAVELADFIDVKKNDPRKVCSMLMVFQYLATEIFDSFPRELQSLSYSAAQNDSRLAEMFTDPISSASLDRIMTNVPSSVAESLETYGLLEEQSDFPKFLAPILQEYVNAATAAPPIWSTTRTTACEICEREWIPLSYHHLIPKQTHAKAVKRGWHEEWRLNSVAWLCRACHSFVHRIASNEELAREYWTVERLMGREDVIAWAKWVGKVRWKAR